MVLKIKNREEELQDGGRVRHGDHLPPHKYIRNKSICGTTLTEHLPNAGIRPQTSQKVRKSPRTWVGQKKKQRQKNRDGTAPQEGAVREEMFPHTRKPLHGRGLWWEEGGSFGATEESAATGVRRAKRRDSRTEGQGGPALTSARGLSAPPPGRAGLGAEARASVGSQGEDWGWRCEHSLKGLVRHSCQEGVREKVCSCGRGKRLFLASLFPGARGEGIQSAT